MPGEFTTSLLGAKECFEKAALQKTFKKYIKKHKKGIKKVESLVETSTGKESVLAQLRVQDLYRKTLFSTLAE